MIAARTDYRLFTALMAALISLAWLALWTWSVSPYALFLNHGILGELKPGLSGEYLVLLLVFVAGWTLMITAMMLPTSLPLVLLFRRLTRQRSDGSRLVVLLVAGYIGVWTLFGGLALVGDLFIHETVGRSVWLEANAWLIGAGTITLAGLYQFTPLKYACLDRCRSPLSFVAQHWRGKREAVQALRLGAHHGLFCVGCCWSLMLLMFVVGVGNLGWMLALGAVMAVEKNVPWGRRMSVPLGLVLVGWGVILGIIHTQATLW